MTNLLPLPIAKQPFNCWIADGFDAVQMTRDLHHFLNGQGGSLEQSYLYLDNMSALAWCSIASQQAYHSADSLTPMEYMTNAVRMCLLHTPYDKDSLDVIALGCGDGRRDTNVIRHLRQYARIKNIRFYLLDLSQPLLCEAYRYASYSLSDDPNIFIGAIQGNMHHLPRYQNVLGLPGNNLRKKLICLLGYTFGNLDNELLFIRNNLHTFAKGDMLLLDVVLAFEKNSTVCYEADPWLNGTSPWKTLTENWFAGIIRRYRENSRDIQFEAKLDTATNCIPGSYTIEIQAKIDNSLKFTMLRFKRYDANLMILALDKEGWGPVIGKRYGDNRFIYLFEKK